MGLWEGRLCNSYGYVWVQGFFLWSILWIALCRGFCKRWLIGASRFFLLCGRMGLWEGRLCNNYGYVWV